ncbi:MAG: hypothetical protein WD845_06615 [Pirellulales bacterium]
MTREDVIRRIVERDVSQQSLVADRVAEQDHELYAAACQQFGTWETALRYAGVGRRSLFAGFARRRELLLARIDELCVKGANLSAEYNRQRRPALYRAARTYFGSWAEVLVAAAIDPAQAESSTGPRHLDRAAIIDALKRRHAAMRPMTWSATCREDHGLATAAKHCFSNWQAALHAAGLQPSRKTSKRPRRRWSKDSIRAAIQQRHRDGKSLAANRVYRDDPPLVPAAIRYFGSWTAALAAAGIDRNVPPPGRDDAP